MYNVRLIVRRDFPTKDFQTLIESSLFNYSIFLYYMIPINEDVQHNLIVQIQLIPIRKLHYYLYL